MTSHEGGSLSTVARREVDAAGMQQNLVIFRHTPRDLTDTRISETLTPTIWSRSGEKLFDNLAEWSRLRAEAIRVICTDPKREF